MDAAAVAEAVVTTMLIPDLLGRGLAAARTTPLSTRAPAAGPKTRIQPPTLLVVNSQQRQVPDVEGGGIKAGEGELEAVQALAPCDG